MKNKLKKDILAFLESHNDGSEETAKLIEKVRYETYFADVDAFSVCPDDLENLGESAEEDLREKLGIDECAPFTLEHCEEVANAMAEYLADEFSENIHNAIHYQL